MFTFKKDKTIFFDVDNTLVIWDDRHEDSSIELAVKSFFKKHDSGSLFCEFGKVHDTHVKLIKFLKFSGFGVVVWSQAGYEHAENIVTQLNLQNYVDIIMSKPTLYYDDNLFENQGIVHRYIGKIPKLNY